MKKLLVVMVMCVLMAGVAWAGDDKNAGYPEPINGPGLHFKDGRWYGLLGSFPQMTPPTMITINEVLNAKVIDAYKKDAVERNLPMITQKMIAEHPAAVAWLILVEANRQALALESKKVKVILREGRPRSKKPDQEIGFSAPTVKRWDGAGSMFLDVIPGNRIVQIGETVAGQPAVIQPPYKGIPNQYAYLNVQTFILNPAETRACIADLAAWQRGEAR